MYDVKEPEDEQLCKCSANIPSAQYTLIPLDNGIIVQPVLHNIGALLGSSK